VKKRSVGDYSGIPYVCTLLNCLLWVVYGLPWVKFQVLVVTINAAGCFIELIYIAFYLKNAQKSIRVI
jgi:solute carrier family 50 protein (sugar transporter)